MPPIPVGVGNSYLKLMDDMTELTYKLSDSYLMDPYIVRSAILYLQRHTVMSLEMIITGEGHNQLHKLLWQLREGERSIPVLRRYHGDIAV